jgi:hypothetical protein
MLAAALASFSRVFDATKPAWGRFPAWFQVLAPTLLTASGAIIAGLAHVTTPTDLAVAIVGGLMLLGPGIPSHRSSAPLPSNPKPPTGLASALALLLAIGLAFHSTGCAWFKGSFWPNVAKCAPSAASLVAQVGQLLAAGGDYETALEQLALADGKDLVLCAVQAFVNSVGSKVGASPDELAAVARGKAFLAEHPVGQ